MTEEITFPTSVAKVADLSVDVSSAPTAGPSGGPGEGGKGIKRLAYMFALLVANILAAAGCGGSRGYVRSDVKPGCEDVVAAVRDLEVKRQKAFDFLFERIPGGGYGLVGPGVSRKWVEKSCSGGPGSEECARAREDDVGAKELIRLLGIPVGSGDSYAVMDACNYGPNSTECAEDQDGLVESCEFSEGLLGEASATVQRLTIPIRFQPVGSGGLFYRPLPLVVEEQQTSATGEQCLTPQELGGVAMSTSYLMAYLGDIEERAGRMNAAMDAAECPGREKGGK